MEKTPVSAEGRPAALEVHNLSLALEGAKILDGVSFRVQKGEFVALIGPNGAGKSSLVRCIDRIYTAYRGEIFIGGVATSGLANKKRARMVAYVPQGGGDTGAFSVREFVFLGRYPWKAPFEPETGEDVRIVEESMELCGIAAFAERPMHSLSGGERQKVLIAAALAQRSDLLLLDEPTAYLDYRHQVDLLNLVRRIHREEGKTVLAVTHDLNFALQSADRMIALSSGVLVWEGTPRELLEAGLLEGLFSIGFTYLPQAAGLPFVVPAAFFGDAAQNAGPGEPVP